MKRLIKNRPVRRAIGGICVVVGALLMWLAPNVLPGAMLFVAGIAVEILGIVLEHRDRG